jgi:hypothetical protein
MSVGGTFTQLRCYQGATALVALTYTLRVNGANTSLTCTVPILSKQGLGTGSVAFAAGDLIDIATPPLLGVLKPGSFALTFQ